MSLVGHFVEVLLTYLGIGAGVLILLKPIMSAVE